MDPVSMPCDSGDAAVFQFTSCPPHRRFQSLGGNQSLLSDFVASQGVPKEWWCGRTSGLRLRTTPRVLTSNLTANLANGFSLSLRFQPGNTSTAELQTILTISCGRNGQSDLDGCLGSLLQVGQYGNHMLLRYRDVSGVCRVLLLRGVGLLESSVAKLTILADRSQTLSFLNGHLVERSAGMDLSDDEEEEYRRVRLFGSQDNDIDHFQGSLHRLSFLNSSTLLTDLVANNTTDCNGTDAAFVFNITSSLPSGALRVPQGSNQSFAIFIPIPNSIAVDIRLDSLPKYGMLQPKGQDKLITSNVSVPPNLEYTSTDPRFFNNPHINVRGIEQQLEKESFSYQLLSFDDDGFLVAKSEVTDFPVVVQLVNHRPEIVAPKAAVLAGDTWKISGIQVLDPFDHDLNYVRVDITSRRGRVTVTSEEARSLLRQYDCTGRSASPWQCSGDGYQDRHLTFVAAPGDATQILKELEYQSLSSSRPEADNVTVIVYDGEGGDCLTMEEHSSYQQALGNQYASLHPNGCVSVQVTVEIPGFVVQTTGGRTTGGVGDTQGILPDLLFWLVFFAAMFCMCFSKLRNCALRGTAVYADGDEDAEEDVNNMNRPDNFSDDFYPSEVSVMSDMYLEEVSLT